MTNTPHRPSSTAAQRARPTRSRSKGTDITVISSGAAKQIAIVVASGRWRSASKKASMEHTDSAPRSR